MRLVKQNEVKENLQLQKRFNYLNKQQLVDR